MRKPAPKTAPAAAPRELVVTRSTMSYAFEASVRSLIAEGDAASAPRRDLGLVVASTLDVSGRRKRPAWTVSKRAAPTKGRKRR